jgi:molybdopterin-guanine dinucleotide biosynthesis protein A
VDTLGVVLAGGRGSRLAAGVPKAHATLLGRTLLARAVATLETLCDAVVVAAPADLPLGAFEALRATDPPHAAGPLAGLVAGLGVHAHGRALVLGVDFPLITGAHLASLRDQLGRSAAPAVAPCPAGVMQPLVSALLGAAAEPLAAALANGERSPAAAFTALGVERLDDAALATLGVPVAAFLNVNAPADLEAAARALVRRGASAA